jgi:hypothetical protein
MSEVRRSIAAPLEYLQNTRERIHSTAAKITEAVQRALDRAAECRDGNETFDDVRTPNRPTSTSY